MKTLLALVAFTAFQVAASDLIDLRSRITTFTNLQGQAFSNVTLIRADLDGVLWRKEASGGRVCYTNLDLGLLELWGIPTNRAEIARERAAKTAAAHSRFLAERAAAADVEAQSREQARLEWEAAAPAREKLAQMKIDSERLDAMRARIAEFERRIKALDAVTPTSAAGSADFVNAVMTQRAQINLAQNQLDDAKAELKRLQAEFDRKYREVLQKR